MLLLLLVEVPKKLENKNTKNKTFTTKTRETPVHHELEVFLVVSDLNCIADLIELMKYLEKSKRHRVMMSGYLCCF